MKKEKMVSKIDLNYKGEDYELRFFKSDVSSYLIKFGLMKNKRISYKETNLFHQYYIFYFLIKEIRNFIYNNNKNINKLEDFSYVIKNKKLNNINQYALKKNTPFGYIYEVIENPCGGFKTTIKHDPEFLAIIKELDYI